MTQNVFFEAIAYTNMDTKLLPHVKGMCPVHRYTSWWSESRTPFTPPTGLRSTVLHCNTKISMLHTEKLIRIPVRSRFQRCNMPLLLRICLTDL